MDSASDRKYVNGVRAQIARQLSVGTVLVENPLTIGLTPSEFESVHQLYLERRARGQSAAKAKVNNKAAPEKPQEELKLAPTKPTVNELFGEFEKFLRTKLHGSVGTANAAVTPYVDEDEPRLGDVYLCLYKGSRLRSGNDRLIELVRICNETGKFFVKSVGGAALNAHDKRIASKTLREGSDYCRVKRANERRFTFPADYPPKYYGDDE